MADSGVDEAHKVTAGLALAFGAAGVLAPRALTSTYGLHDDSPDYRYLARMWGARNAAIGVLSLTAEGDAKRLVCGVTAAMGAVDTFVVLTTRGLSARTKAMAGLTSAGIAGANAYVALNG